MANKNEQSPNMLLDIKTEFIKSQFEQAMETYRTQFSLLVQALTILVLADVTVIGYAISTQISGILLIGTLFPIMILYMMKRANRLMIPVVYTAISLEHKYGGDDGDWLASTFLSHVASVEYVNTLQAISTIQNPVERIKQIRSTKAPLIGQGIGLTRAALALVVLGQVIAPIFLTLVYRWRVF